MTRYPLVRDIFKTEPAGEAEIKAFRAYIKEQVEWECHRPEKIVVHTLADLVHILDSRTGAYLMTSKFTLSQHWPEFTEQEIEALERRQ